MAATGHDLMAADTLSSEERLTHLRLEPRPYEATEELLIEASDKGSASEGFK